MSFYAVRFGKNPGVYNSWNECKKQVSGFKGAIYKKFSTEISAVEFCKNKDKTYNVLKKINKCNNNAKDINIKNLQETCEFKDPNSLYIFTDGSSINNGTKRANSGFGIYIPEPDEMKVKISSKLPKGKTNNYAELKAIFEALKLIDCTEKDTFKKINKSKIVIVTDSQYSINCVTKWANKWIENNWISSTGKKVKNKELIKEIHPLYIKHNISFKHIKAHTNNKGFFYDGNRVVDKLANGSDI